MTTALERLEAMLDEKDERIRDLENQVESLQQQLDGSADGWRRSEEFDDNGLLPVPRLELVYTPHPKAGWTDYVVLYRLVVKHLLDKMVGIPLGHTRISGGIGNEPDGLPFRDGSHAAHDSAHLGLPVYKLMPGRDPVLLQWEGYPHQTKMGAEHTRREAVTARVER